MALQPHATWADHLAMDIDKAAWITIERALARVPLGRGFTVTCIPC
jgi:hypothetical protein